MKKLLLTLLFQIFVAIGIGWAASTDFVDWGQLGPELVQLATPQIWTSNGGLTGEIGLVGPVNVNFERLDEGSGWIGNFAPRDHLIWNTGSTSGFESIAVQFNFDTFGGGAQIQAAPYGPFFATLTAFDDFGSVIAQVTLNGDSNPQNDGSAVFIGFHDVSADVHFLTFAVVDANGENNEAINGLTIYTSAVTPEPTSGFLLGSGLLSLLCSGRAFLVGKPSGNARRLAAMVTKYNRGSTLCVLSVLFFPTIFGMDRLSAQTTYSTSQITINQTDHEWPSLNDNDVMAWSEQVAGSCPACSNGWTGYPCTANKCWQVFKFQNGNRVQVTSDTHNHVFPSIDNSGSIMYLKDNVGAGPGLQVILRSPNNAESVVEFSSGNPPGCAEPPAIGTACQSWRAAGLHFGSTNAGAQTISYFDFCRPQCQRTFDVSGVGQVANLFPSAANYLDIAGNVSGDTAYSMGSNVYKASLGNKTTTNIPGNAGFPRINSNADISLLSNGQVQVRLHQNYQQASIVNQTTTALWADLNSNGHVVYEDVDTTGFHQIFQGIPSCTVSSYIVPNVPLRQQQNDLTCWATAGAMLRSWKDGTVRDENYVATLADAQFPVGHFFVTTLNIPDGLTPAAANNFVGRLGMNQSLPGQPTVCQLNDRLRTNGPAWVVTGTFNSQGHPGHAEVLVGISGDGTDTGTIFTLVDPLTGSYDFMSYQSLMLNIAAEGANNQFSTWP